MKKQRENLTPREQELMELLGKQWRPTGDAGKDIDTILKAELPENGGELSTGDIRFICYYVYNLGRINGIREERAKRKAKGQSKGGAEK